MAIMHKGEDLEYLPGSVEGLSYEEYTRKRRREDWPQQGDRRTSLKERDLRNADWTCPGLGQRSLGEELLTRG